MHRRRWKHSPRHWYRRRACRSGPMPRIAPVLRRFLPDAYSKSWREILARNLGRHSTRSTSMNSLIPNFTRKFTSRGVAAASAALIAQIFPAALTAVPAHAADYDIGSIHISTPWARATPQGASAGAGYMAITNKGTASD